MKWEIVLILDVLTGLLPKYINIMSTLIINNDDFSVKKPVLMGLHLKKTNIMHLLPILSLLILLQFKQRFSCMDL